MRKFVSLLAALSLAGCASQDIPQAHKGRKFDKTGIFAFFVGGHGFEGPILGPSTVFLGIYPEVRMIDCSQRTVKEPLEALTKDGVQFNLDIYVRFSANCDEDRAVEKLLSTLSPAPDSEPKAEDKKADPNKENQHDVEHDPIEPNPTLTITSKQLYTTYVRPALGEAVREAVSAYVANEINSKRDEIFSKIRDQFTMYLSKGDPKLISLLAMNLSNLDFPDQLEKANTDRATQAVLKDKAIAERERVQAEIETTKMRLQLVTNEAANEATKIDAVGAALKRNPEYVTMHVFEAAGEKGNLIVLPHGTPVMLQLPAKK